MRKAKKGSSCSGILQMRNFIRPGWTDGAEGFLNELSGENQEIFIEK